MVLSTQNYNLVIFKIQTQLLFLITAYYIITRFVKRQIFIYNNTKKLIKDNNRIMITRYDTVS